MDSATLIVIVLTVGTSLLGFSNREIFERLKFNVNDILRYNQWDRLITSALLHGDWMHLLFNMLTLYFFSDVVISTLGRNIYILIYIAAILCGNLLSLWMHKKNSYYSAIGASGGVSGILFASIALYPHLELIILPIPIPIPGWLFGVGYIAYSIYAMKKMQDNIGHEAHLGGATIGLLLAIAIQPRTLEYNGLYIAIMCIPLLVLAYLAYKEKK
ncbi:rhomboid family intramembrane serine protease [Dysgonomonas sp. 520]|nr:rhomboid family intramembrane serine protease [Dysgonomonas sp. 520]